MSASPAQRARALEIRSIILAELALGIRTTEQLRAAARDTRDVIYNHLRQLKRDNLIECNNPKRLMEKRWRLKRNPPATQTAPGDA